MNWELISSIMMTTLPAAHSGPQALPQPHEAPGGRSRPLQEALSRDHHTVPQPPRRREAGGEATVVWAPGVGAGAGLQGLAGGAHSAQLLREALGAQERGQRASDSSDGVLRKGPPGLAPRQPS